MLYFNFLYIFHISLDQIFNTKRKIDSLDHYDDHYMKFKDLDVTFKAPVNSKCHTEHASFEAGNSFLSAGIDFFPEKSSPISKRREKLYSFSARSRRNEKNEMTEQNINDSIIEQWTNNFNYDEKIEKEIKGLIDNSYENNPGYFQYKTVLECISCHLDDDKNLLGSLLREYIDYLLKNYQFIDQVIFENISYKNLRTNFLNMMTDIHEFAHVFCLSLSEFYQFATIKEKNSCLQKFLVDLNIENYVLQLIYQKTDIYDIIYEIEKNLASEHDESFIKIKSLFEQIELQDCFTPYEKQAKMQLLTPNTKKTSQETMNSFIDSERVIMSKGFDNFSLAFDHYDNKILDPLIKYKDLISGLKFWKNPYDKLMIFNHPRLIIRKFMGDMMEFPDFEQIDERDEIKILFFLIFKLDIMPVFIELNIIVHTVRARPKELKIVQTLLKSIKSIIKLLKKDNLGTYFKEKGFLAKLIEKKYLKKCEPF